MSITKEEFERELTYLQKTTKVFDINFKEEIDAFSNIAKQRFNSATLSAMFEKAPISSLK